MHRKEKTSLICAADNGRTGCMLLLLESGADKDATDKVRNVFSVQKCFGCDTKFGSEVLGM